MAKGLCPKHARQIAKLAQIAWGKMQKEVTNPPPAPLPAVARAQMDMRRARARASIKRQESAKRRGILASLAKAA